MKDLGEASYIMGIMIYRDRSRGLLGLSRSTYIDKVLKRFSMDLFKRGNIPMLHGNIPSLREIHTEPFQYLIYVWRLWKTKQSSGSISIDPNSQNVGCFAKVFHGEFIGQPNLHSLKSRNVISILICHIHKIWNITMLQLTFLYTIGSSLFCMKP